MEEGEEQEYIDSVAMGFCPNCGKAVERNPVGRPRKFCSAKCRDAWRWSHPKPENWKSARTAVCPECGRQFTASREYGNPRKYCSHACANKGRSKGKKTKCV